jgi:hypothetical protein
LTTPEPPDYDDDPPPMSRREANMIIAAIAVVVTVFLGVILGREMLDAVDEVNKAPAPFDWNTFAPVRDGGTQ